MKIAIYDILHEETLATVIRIFSGEEVHVFTTPRVAGILKNTFTVSSIHWHVLDEAAPMRHPNEIRKQNKKVQFDYIILSTVHQHHLLFSTLGNHKAKLILMVHDSSSLQPKPTLGLRAVARYTGAVLLNKAADGFFVLSSQVKEHILTSKLTRKPLIVMPGAVWEEKITLNIQQEFIISIPGTLDVERRNYEELLDLVPLLRTEKVKFTFVFLGASKGESDISLLAEDIRSRFKGVDVIYFPGYIEQDVFDSWLKRSHVVYLPVRPVVVRMYGDERYGRTKISGGFYDAVRFSRIILHSAEIPVADEFKMQVHTYGSVNELGNWINTAAYDAEFYLAAQERANQNASKFELEEVRSRILSEIQQIR